MSCKYLSTYCWWWGGMEIKLPNNNNCFSFLVCILFSSSSLLSSSIWKIVHMYHRVYALYLLFASSLARSLHCLSVCLFILLREDWEFALCPIYICIEYLLLVVYRNRWIGGIRDFEAREIIYIILNRIQYDVGYQESVLLIY